jgi:hypothetical protein
MVGQYMKIRFKIRGAMRPLILVVSLSLTANL